jgi:hypothetical protein
LTCATNKKTFLAAWLLVCLGGIAGAVQLTPTREITSNNMFSLAGHGDTLCMISGDRLGITNAGINFTFATSDSFSWYGYKTTLFSGAIAFGDGTIVATMRSESKNVSRDFAVLNGPLWVYHFPALKTNMLDGTNYKVLDSIFFRAPNLNKLKHDADFSIVDAAWSKGAFWLACSDGGVARLDNATNSLKAFFPGSKNGFLPAQIIDSSGLDVTTFPDTAKRVIALAVEDSSAATPVVWVVTPEKLWKFSYGDSTWDSVGSSLADSAFSFIHYQNAYALKTSDTEKLFASIQIRKKKSSSADTIDTVFFKYDFANKSWGKRLDKAPISLTFGQDGEMYVNVENYVSLYQETPGGDALAISGDNSPDKFQKRMTRATGVDYPDNINGMLFVPQASGKAFLWIASSANVLPSVNNGLFYSYDEKSDEQNNRPFGYVHGDKKINNGLKECYAFPSILNSMNGSKAMFAYNLSKASKVTIMIYDWNMDPVRTVIKNKDRPAGNDRANGRSTNAAEDTWDGTTDTGRRVAMGVYYYKITAQSGEHAFGKIIMAK